MKNSIQKEIAYFLPYAKLNDLILQLQQAGYDCIGPQVSQGVIVYESLSSADALPWGIRDRQAPGQYRLETIAEKKAFAFSNGPQAIKPLLFKPRETVWRVMRDEHGKLQFQPIQLEEKPLAILGARACDIAAMQIQDKAFLDKDSHYRRRRETALIIGVNCAYSSDNCFCVSAGTGPEIKQAYDLVMTEVDQGFVMRIGTAAGKMILDPLQLQSAESQQKRLAAATVAATANMQKKRIPFDNSSKLRDVLLNQLDHPQWENVAQRCLSCGNCTQVCPTCFCNSEQDVSNMQGDASEHVREWDSCFNAGHSKITGMVIRDDTKKRYRQWLTHKVGTWFEQFGTSGCVGCGRCISFCPVGIDITEELSVMTGESNVSV